jgi:starch-binding outer membrane protein, SusD/RagB family
MNKLHRIIILISIVIFWQCSDDFLERDNPAASTIENFYQTENDFNLALTGVYNVLVRADYYNGYLVRYLEIASDDANPGDDALFNSLIGNDIANFSMTPEAYTTINIFASSYIGIARANTTIERVRASSLNENFKTQIEAESRFLRALFYFNLVRLYGDTPLILKEITNPNETLVPRTPVEEVYEAGIIPDLLFAAEKLPSSRANEDIARVTSWAAKGLLAKVYLTLGSFGAENFGKSKEVLWEIISSSQFSLEENFADLYLRENEFGKESLFEINFMSGQHFYNFEGYGMGAYVPQRNGIGSYYNNSYMPRFRGTAYMGEEEGAFARGGFGIGIPTTSNDPRGVNYNVPTGTGIVELFAEGDMRKQTTILDYYKTAEDYGLPVDYDIAPYNVNKYTDYADTENGEADDNFYIIRLADVYLMFAEVENEINNGPTPDAFEYLNKVKRRAFGLPVNEPSEADYSNLDYQQFLDIIYKERRLELAFEGQRWFDLIRRPQRALQIMQNHGKLNVSVDRLLLPIPQYVIEETDGIITQNPGYN